MTFAPKLFLINKKNKRSASGLFIYLLVLTALFFLMQVSFFFEFSGFYLGDFKGVSHHLHIPESILPPVLFYLATQLTLHFLLVVWVWIEAELIGAALNYTPKKTESLGLILWCFSVGEVVLANQIFYPHSLFSTLTETVLNQTVATGLWVVLSLVLGSALLMSLVGLVKKIQTKYLIFSGGIVFFVILFFIYPSNPARVVDKSSFEKPNIILIGIDALRPDFTGFFGSSIQTPALDDFFTQSVVFSDALTPIARTFPAWVSILLGKYPKESGIRTDLQNQSQLNDENALPMLLRNRGYETVFATDETRFSNIDERFGFDKIIVPTMGLSDFLLGTLNDFPLSNLVVNTFLGRRLFQNSYGNRPAFATYDPDSFLKLLNPVLKTPRDKPLFLAVHFCLTHYPYVWDQAPLRQKPLQYYQAAVHRVDQQLADYLLMLQKNKILDHAIVIILSDHGEAIELHGDRATDPELYVPLNNNPHAVLPHFYPMSSSKETIDESAGHGTDVLGITQYHTVLAARLYGLQHYSPRIVSERVSLLDIKPLVLDLLNHKKTVFSRLVSPHSPEDFFTESDFSPEAVRTAHPEMRKALFEGIDYFQLDPKTLRFTVRKKMEQLILSCKQYADYRGDWVLALYPQQNKTMTPVLVNLQTGEWTDNLNTDFSKESPAQGMLDAMKRFFGKEIVNVSYTP